MISQRGATQPKSVIYLHHRNVCLGKAIRNITGVCFQNATSIATIAGNAPFLNPAGAARDIFVRAIPQCPPTQLLQVTAFQAEEAILKLSTHRSTVSCLPEGSAPPVLLEAARTAVHARVPSSR